LKKVFFIFFVVLISCNISNKKDTSKTIARVYDKYLFIDDLAGVVPPKTSEKDSIEITNNYINNWIRENLEINKAENNLSEEQKDFQKQIDDYRNSLIVFKYKQKLIQEQLDTIVTEKEIKDYYENNKSNFELKDNIIKVVYVKLNLEAPNIKLVKNFIKSDKEEDKEKLEDYCQRYAVNYFLDDESWLLFNDLLKEIPIKTYNQEAYLKNNRTIEIKDSLYYYFVNIKGFKIKNSISPLDFEKERIRNIIINIRKLELIKKMQEDVFKNAQSKNNFEIY